ncbi:MAG: histidinol phosphatase [Acidobacteria bacterium]|nr:MAG: histidinol phosphatase [Acidobacteriota bacterium]
MSRVAPTTQGRTSHRRTIRTAGILGMDLGSTLDVDLALAHRLADGAASVSLSYFRRELKSWSKDDGSLATEADLAVEDELRTRLGIERPGDAILGEERRETGLSRRRWILDGIDGTVDFAAGRSDWSTLVALEVDGRVVVSVRDQPAQQRRYWAVRGHGAFCSTAPFAPSRLRVSTVRELRSARSYVPPPEWLPDERARRVAEAVARATRPTPELNHPAFQVATGGYEVAVFFLAGPRDLAGPALIVEEAGGRFTDIGGRHDLTAGTAVFSNGVVHDEILQVIATTQ